MVKVSKKAREMLFSSSEVNVFIRVQTVDVIGEFPNKLSTQHKSLRKPTGWSAKALNLFSALCSTEVFNLLYKYRNFYEMSHYRPSTKRGILGRKSFFNTQLL